MAQEISISPNLKLICEFICGAIVPKNIVRVFIAQMMFFGSFWFRNFLRENKWQDTVFVAFLVTYYPISSIS